MVFGEGKKKLKPNELVCQLTVASFAGGNLSQVSVIIALHFQVEDFAFWITGFGNEEFVQESLMRLKSEKEKKKSISKW